MEDIGASGYELMLTIGIIGLVFSILFTPVSLLLTSNAQKKEEKNSHALVICVVGIAIFSDSQSLVFSSQSAQVYKYTLAELSGPVFLSWR